MKIFRILMCTFVLLATTGSFAAANTTISHSSDTVGVKLEHPTDWLVDDFRWGYMLTDPITSASVSVHVYFLPKEMEKEYDINMNEEFSKIYGGWFESVEEGEKEISGLTWDYVTGHGSIGTPMEYYETSYSLLIENTVYSIELYHMANAKKELLDEMNKVIESVRLMYKKSELPVIREYKKDWNSSKKENGHMTFTILDGDVVFNYASPWMFAGTGANTKVSFHYLSGDPLTDVDMIVVKLPMLDVKLATTNILAILASMTSPYASETDDEVRINGNKYYVKYVTQGIDESILHTRFYTIDHNGESLIVIFAYHEKAKESADEIIAGLMDGMELVRK
ncbi:hypothetical protein KKB99_04050 [bacterium]|nr:hypothetical protein [bacterium]MBU1025166.1 hypothetical protein [bacterium]